MGASSKVYIRAMVAKGMRRDCNNCDWLLAFSQKFLMPVEIVASGNNAQEFEKRFSVVSSFIFSNETR